MSTRSLIVVEKMKEGKKVYTGVYCHWDGYPSNNGAILFSWYKDRVKAEKLVSLGDISSLGKYISPDECGGGEHSFDNPMANVTVYYGRDRGETDVEPFEVEDLNEKIDQIWHEFVYVYGLDNVWRVFVPGHEDRITLVGIVLDEGEDILYSDEEEED